MKAKRMKKYSILLVMLVILASGCVSSSKTSTVDANRGLTITSFAADPSNARAGELILFDIDVGNIGGTTARNAQVDLFGVENQWKTATGSIVDSTLTKELGTMSPPDPSRNIAGATKLVAYQLITPDIPQGISPTLSIEARVTYDYNTSGFINIPAISEDEYRRQQSIGEAIVTAPTVVNSPGPIHMSMDPKFSPIRVDTTSADDAQTVPIRITFTNVGDGFPITGEDDAAIRGTGGKISGTVDLLGPAVEFSDCLGETSGTHIDLDNTDIALRLRQSGTFTMPCTLSVDKTAWGNRPTDDVKLVFNLFYRYYVSARTSITVTGR